MRVSSSPFTGEFYGCSLEKPDFGYQAMHLKIHHFNSFNNIHPKSHMMRIIEKKLLTGARGSSVKSKLCLVITFADGMRAQYSVKDELEAYALYRHYSKLHPGLQQAMQG